MPNHHLQATRHLFLNSLFFVVLTPVSMAQDAEPVTIDFEKSGEFGSPPISYTEWKLTFDPDDFEFTSLNGDTGRFSADQIECEFDGQLYVFVDVLAEFQAGAQNIVRLEGIGEHPILGDTTTSCAAELTDNDPDPGADPSQFPTRWTADGPSDIYKFTPEQGFGVTTFMGGNVFADMTDLIQGGGGGEPAPDSDGDGIPDEIDNCAGVPNNQADFDNDGLGDACDVSRSPDPDADYTTVSNSIGMDEAMQAFRDGITPNLGVRFATEFTGYEFPAGTPGEQVVVGLGQRLSLTSMGSRMQLTRAPGGPSNSLFVVEDGGHLVLENVDVTGIFGGAIGVEPGGRLTAIDVWFTTNENPDGGAVTVVLDPTTLQGSLPALEIGCSADNEEERCCLFEGNTGHDCGALCIYSENELVEIGDRIEPVVSVSGCGFFNNTVDVGACDIHTDAFACADSDVCISFTDNHFSSSCRLPSVEVSDGNPFFAGNSWLGIDDGGQGVIQIDPTEEGTPETTTIMEEVEHSLVITQQTTAGSSRSQSQQAASACSPNTEVNSLGYNLSTDATCDFDHATDLENTDPMKGPPDANGIRAPLAGSPLIDHGPSELIQFDGATWPSLPCGYRDIYGLGRPQDGDGDGEFECDIGAVEFPGAGGIVPGHSGAFIDPDLDGEGQFVQILSDTTAAIFTFTYRPGGDGPAWFLGIADIVGNSLVVNDLLRPVGTSFGDGFNAGDVWLAPNGGMSMIFPSCESANQPGRVVYSGSAGLGYQPLISEAQRLTGYVACDDGGIAPSPNAALSGPFGDPLRDGEGLVIQWLPGNVVAVVFFTYDFQDNQMWVVASGIAEDKSVTMNAFYPTSFPAWGSEPNPDNVQVVPWGTMTLEYLDCDTANFSYESTVEGYGSAEYVLQRIAPLAGTACPEF